jgi:glycosyltransferase involved in cell wall biosynthesis
MLTLSIIIPTREEEAAIAETITQFETLSISHEIIVADSESRDATVAIAGSLGARIASYTSAQRTAGKNRNAGAKIANGEYLVFIDCGVRIPKPNSFFAHALADFTSRKKLVGITGPQYANPAIATLADKISFYIFNLGIKLQNNVMGRGEASGKFIMVPREVYEAVNGFREDIATREDGDFFCRVSRLGAVYFDSYLAVYHDARRAHTIGWAKLWWEWATNYTVFIASNASKSKDWKPIR